MVKYLSVTVLSILFALVICKDVTRSKRQMNVYYMCGNYPNSYVSQYPCRNSGNGCGYGSCSGLSTAGILPSSFYNPNNNCYNGCNNLNCNQYNGMWVNGQYVAYSYGSNRYNPCASSCCSGFNNNGFNTYNGGYQIGTGALPTGFTGFNPYNNGGYQIGTGALPTNPVVGGIGLNAQVGPCGGVESSSGSCFNGYCGDGAVCTSGNICCPCAVGASSGRCNFGAGCSAGFSCTQNGYCCASTPWQQSAILQQCVNNSCAPGYACGEGNICYPQGSTVPGQDCLNGKCPVGYTCGNDNKCYSNAGK